MAGNLLNLPAMKKLIATIALMLGLFGGLGGAFVDIFEGCGGIAGGAETTLEGSMVKIAGGAETGLGGLRTPLFAPATAMAQTDRPILRPREKGPGVIGNPSAPKGMEKLEAPGQGVPRGYKEYTDEGLDELNERMKEREWGNDDGAWGRAKELNTKQSYEKYCAMYPQGAHIGEATIRLIDAKVAEMLRNAHEDLPSIKRTEPDDDSPESTLLIRNHTGYPLTVYCSGAVAKTVVIAPDREATVVLDNGLYKLGASVPPSHIRPYAGQTTLRGGRYEIGFWVVTR